MDLPTRLRRQHGVVTSAQARDAGLSFRGIRGRVARGEWLRLGRGIYRAADHAETPESRVWAAMLDAGEDAVLSGASAGWWWGMVPELPSTITVTVPRVRAPRGLAGVRLVRRRLPRVDVVGRHGIDVIDIPLAVLETAVELGGEDGGRVLDRALLRRVALDDVRQAYWRAMGRRGAAEMARLVVLAADRAASELERRAVRLVRDEGLADYEVNAPLHLDGQDLVIDLLFRAAKVAVEFKGWAFHRDPATLQSDADRENALQLAGYTVITLTWWDVTLRPRRTLARIRAALGAAVAA